MICISIHALREEGDFFNAKLTVKLGIFLSTPSARRATVAIAPNSTIHGISIHALREEGDGAENGHVCVTARFLSTPSARRATTKALA